MVLLVHGFPSKVAALQFEWAWQNPHLSRQTPQEVKESLRKKPRLSLPQRVAVLREMLGFEAWRRWPLKVAILHEDIVKVWIKAGKKEGIRDVEWRTIGEDITELDMEIEGDSHEKKRDLNLKNLLTLDLDDCTSTHYSRKLIIAQFLTPHLEKSHTLLPESKSLASFSCHLCLSSLPENHLEIALCPHKPCASVFHLTCLASHLETTDAILPVKGTCPGCRKEILWGDVIRGVFGRSGRLETCIADDETDLSEDEDEDEDVNEYDENEKPSLPKRTLSVQSTKNPTKQTKAASKPRATAKSSKRNQTENVVMVPETDEEASPKRPIQRNNPRGRPQSKKPTEPRSTRQFSTVPASEPEPEDVWIISSDDNK
jgi:hypothetical protein